MLFITACIVLTVTLPQGIAQARSAGGGDSGGGMGPGTAVSHGGPAGRSTEAYGAGTTATGSGYQAASQASGGMSFGPASGYYGGMIGGGESYGPGTVESFQQNRYGATGTTENTFNEYQQYRHADATAGQYHQGSIAATGPGKVTSMQATGNVPGTCMWDCTASYTPIECQQLCNR